MNEFLLASGNLHKAEEFSDIFDKEVLLIRPASSKLDVVEDGKTFQENAFKKAEAYYKEFKSPVMSDDSGLVIEALPDELGIHTARFGGEGLNCEERCNLLIKKLESESSRKAYFVCILCFYVNPKEIYFFEGRCHGEISQKIQGDCGFGYDPVFLPENLDGKTSFSENTLWKMLNSHRFKACLMASQFFTEGT